MSLQDEARRLRIRGAALADDLKRGDTDPAGETPSLLARTRTLNLYPTTPQCYYACEPLTVLGQETEGAQALVSASGANLFALNLGSTVPPVGTQILITFVVNRWVFRYDA